MNSYDKFVQRNRMRISCNRQKEFFISTVDEFGYENRHKYLYTNMSFDYYSSVRHDELMKAFSKANSARIIRTILKNKQRIVYDTPYV